MTVFQLFFFLGMFLMDLTFIQEGGSSTVGEYQLINFFKCRCIAQVIKRIQQYQQKGYELERVVSIQVKRTKRRRGRNKEAPA